MSNKVSQQTHRTLHILLFIPHRTHLSNLHTTTLSFHHYFGNDEGTKEFENTVRITIKSLENEKNEK